MNLYSKYNKEEIITACKNAYSKSQMARNLGILHSNSTVMRQMSKFIIEYNLDTEHFDTGLNRRKYNIVTKICPVCKKQFETPDGGKSEKQTCGYACSNTHFRSGADNGMHKNGASCGGNYRTICFINHKRECIICGENRIIAVHHYDGNHKNNDPKNLIPLCPTHHQYFHSKHRHLIEEKISEYVNSQQN